MKKKFYTEIAYLLGVLFLCMGTAFMQRANFGMSMVVAPAYILHLKLSRAFPFFSFGMAEYCLQFVLILFLCFVLRQFKKGYLFSFVTAVVYGLVLDVCIAVISRIPDNAFVVRCVLFLAGMVCCSIGVAMFFHTYFAPEAYELVVKEIALQKSWDIGKVKTAYDLISLSISVVLSFAFFGFLHFEGVNIGTLITALVNGWIIGRISAWMDRSFQFADGLPLRKKFEG